MTDRSALREIHETLDHVKQRVDDLATVEPPSVDVSDYVTVERVHCGDRWAVALYDLDGARRVIYGGERGACELIANGIGETLSTWPGWRQR
jgi:hypothetical protein